MQGYNHEVVHLGWHFHVQTEDSGPQKAHIFTHLFHDGSILATKKLTYDPASKPDFVKDLMQAQHKAILRELKRGEHDARIRQLLGEPKGAEEAFDVPLTDAGASSPPPTVSSIVARDPRLVVDSTALEWKDHLSLPPVPPSYATPRGTSVPPGAVHNPWSDTPLSSAAPDRPFDTGTPLGTARPTSLPPARKLTSSVPVLKLSPATGPDAGLTLVTLPFHDGSAFLDAYSPDDGPAGSVILDPRVNLAVGQEVKLLLRFRNGSVKEFDVRGRVAWRRARPAGELPAGIGVAFLESEKSALDRLVALAEGHAPGSADRRYQRVLAELQVKVAPRHGTKKRQTALDVSEGGIFIKSAVLLPVGEEVTVTLKAPRKLLSFDLHGRVTGHREGKDRGYGVRFLFRDDDERRRVKDLLDRLREDG